MTFLLLNKIILHYVILYYYWLSYIIFDNDSDIVSVFKDAFNDVYFDSYKNSYMYVNCLNRLQSLITADDCDCNVFDITDVENSFCLLYTSPSPRD